MSVTIYTRIVVDEQICGRIVLVWLYNHVNIMLSSSEN